MRKEIRTRSWFLVLFGLPFFAVALYFLITIAGSFYDGMRMASWSQTPGVLISAQLRSNTSDDATTYEALAQYQYLVGGVSYTGSRVALHGGSDNVGDFQQNLGRQLEYHYRSRQPVTVYYNPATPAEAVLNRDMRWGLLGFKAIFVIVFGGAGLGMIVFGLRGKRTIVSPEAVAHPWLARPEWADNRISSGARSGVYMVWGIAVIWNALSTPAAIAIPEIWRKEGALALVILLFPVVGMGLLYWAVKQTLEWRRFGYTPLTMDPFPGAIGGDVGGVIELNIPYDSRLLCDVTLSSLYSYESGSGKDRSRHERVEWQDSGYAQVERSGRGMLLHFCFSVPGALHPSEEATGDYYFWRLNITAKMPGSDLDRSFVIPVYPTGETSRFQQLDTGKVVPHGVAELKAEALLPLRRNGTLQELYYPMLRQPGMALFFTLFGMTFAVTGIVLWGKAPTEGRTLYLLGGVFTTLGSLTAIGGFYAAFNSLYVAWDGKRVLAVRRLLGFTLRWRSVFYHELRGIQLKKGATSTQQGGKHQIHYHVVAQTPKGEMVLAEQLDSHSKAKLVVEFFREQFGLAGTSAHDG